MIRRIGRNALRALAALVASARTDVFAQGNALDAEYIPAVAKSLESRGVFVFGSPNPHGCPWPGSRAACARRTAGKVRRMR